jgi:hypothetical protein
MIFDDYLRAAPLASPSRTARAAGGVVRQFHGKFRVHQSAKEEILAPDVGRPLPHFPASVAREMVRATDRHHKIRNASDYRRRSLGNLKCGVTNLPTNGIRSVGKLIQSRRAFLGAVSVWLEEAMK